ncbi:glycoside hydrolase 43 family protein [Lactococcus hodotermopsidis]|uniref:Glycoside hydrolase 43 family protein n=1 Tax=Pseudolactococcus hodotermopsidis TaxID=2709157 RepID=A0A6A0B9E2_9LACT|nr:glycoside hydrolase family 43 protein [Lactococcus hodotermopsidis]GFH42059.1 glycoside hydrolase 43 family protein [Lactococcus hodotermopsidis]
MGVQNPIISGFAPDPSIVRVGEDYYLVNSSFSYFPSLPIYHSRDLKSWALIANAITRPSQANYAGGHTSRGQFAPTIRHDGGKFYIICTNVSHGGNFIISADDPTAEWSEPLYLPDADGIDPSLYFENGRAYYCGTHGRDGGELNGDNAIYVAEIDLKTGQLGKKKDIWWAAMRDAVWPEGPHINKVGDYYYIFYAEGGTGLNHAIMTARSRSIFGPYENCLHNPILTHRHLGPNFPVVNVGHGDLFEDGQGNWYLICLASRLFDGADNLGRETFIAKVTWHDGWPFVNEGLGQLDFANVPQVNTLMTDFSLANLEVLRLRNPIDADYAFENGVVRLRGGADFADLTTSPTFLAVRQRTIDYDLSVRVQSQSEAGLVVFQNDNFLIRLAIIGKKIKVVQRENGVDTVLVQVAKSADLLKLVCRGQKLAFYVADELILSDVSATFLSTRQAGGFVGTTLGIYALGHGKVATFSELRFEMN